MVDPQSLVGLGLNTYEAAVYLALLSRPELAPAEVARRAGIPRQRVYDVLSTLVAKGLCVIRSTNPKSYVAVNPKSAFDLLVQERTANLERQRKETEALAVQLAGELAPVFALGQGQNDPLAYVEVLSGQSHIAYRAQSLAEAAKKRVNSCIKLPMILPEEQNRLFMKVPLERGLEYRAVCDAEMIESKGSQEWLGQFVAAGLEIKVVEILPLKMQVFDDEVVLISMQDPAGGRPSYTAVAIHNRGAVAMLNLAFEHLWSEGKVFKG
jgi:HTH-type transcriptional regulator, sugar sensing transcriptional regulator